MLFEIGKVYTFNTLSPAFLGAVITRAKFKAMLNAEIARRFTAIDQTHAQVYPTLPPGSPKDPNSAVYYMFEGQNGQPIIFSEHWIDPLSVEVVEYVEITVRVVRASLSDVEKVRVALSAAGIKDFTITT